MTPDVSIGRVSLFIVRSRATSYLKGRMARLLSSFFVALSLLLSPMAMASGVIASTAHAAPPDAGAAAAAHCAGDEMPSPDDTQPEHLSCAAACAALPAAPPPGGTAQAPSDARLLTTHPPALNGFEPEGETPPPRMTPVI